ncbi:MAG: hypothetical protein ABIQ35_02135 [Verrucomicrobiota bacterium]
MALFSQRKGFKPVREIVQFESMDEALRNAIWNCFHNQIINKSGFMDHKSGGGFTYGYGEIHQFADFLWANFLKQAIDTRPQGQDKIYDGIRYMFFRLSWYEVYDFVEFIVSCVNNTEDFELAIDRALELEIAAYRLVGGKIVEITSQTELNAVDAALAQSVFPGASQHLKRALELISDKSKPDARNSIKESISAVESAAKAIAKTPKATLDDAVKVLEKRGELHPCLKAGFSKLYGYTSDEDGIRHAMLDEPNLTRADALFFLVTCSAFINYLKSKI